MLHRILSSRRALCKSNVRWYAAAAPAPNTVYTAAMARHKHLKTTYPGIFDVAKFTKDQKTHIDAAWSANPALVTKWNERAVDMQDRGIRFHYEIGGEKQIEALPQFQPPVQQPVKPMPLTCPEKNWANLQSKLAAGEKLVSELSWLEDYKETPFDGKANKVNLQLIEAHYTCEHIDEWLMKLEQEQDEWRGVAVPVSMADYANWLQIYKRTAEKVGNEEHGSLTSHLINWDKLDEKETTELKAHLEKRDNEFLKFVQSKDPSVTAEKWFGYKAILESIFEPKDMEHYSWNDYSKDLFRAAVWQGKAKVTSLEKEFDRLMKIIKEHRASEVDVKRCAYEKYPDMKFRPETSQELEARDPLVVAKMLVEMREKIENGLVQKSVKETFAPHINRLHEAERMGLQRGLDKYKGEEEAIQERMRWETGGTYNEYVWCEPMEFRKSIAKLESDVAAFNADVVTIEQLADEMVPKMCWMLPNDPRAPLIETFKNNVVAYTKGKGTLSALTKEFFALMPHNQGEAYSDKVNVSPDDHDHIHMFCKINEVRDTLPQYWSISELLQYDCWEMSGYSFGEEGKLKNVNFLHAKLEKEKVDPLLLNLTKILIEDRNCGQLQQIYEDYHSCVSKFNGELHGVLRSADALTDKQYDEILKSLQTANPSKKFFLTREVDPSLLAGFVVKCGVQTLDFSLLGEVEEFKNPKKKEAEAK